MGNIHTVGPNEALIVSGEGLSLFAPGICFLLYKKFVNNAIKHNYNCMCERIVA